MQTVPKTYKMPSVAALSEVDAHTLLNLLSKIKATKQPISCISNLIGIKSIKYLQSVETLLPILQPKRFLNSLRSVVSKQYKCGICILSSLTKKLLQLTLILHSVYCSNSHIGSFCLFDAMFFFTNCIG